MGGARSHLDGFGDFRRGRRKVGTVPSPLLAARRHGGPDSGQRPDPCRHHGGGRGVPGGPLLPGVPTVHRLLGGGGAGWAFTALMARNHGPRGQRHQKGNGVFHNQPVGLYDGRPRHRRLCPRGCSTRGPCRVQALLFLGAGSVNHASGTFDMRYMGGLRRQCR